MNNSIHEITGPDDPHLPAVMDIYQEAFPLNEQVRFSWWLALLKEKEAGNAEHRHLQALVQDEQVVAMAYYQVKIFKADGSTAPPLGYLGYLGTRHDVRGKGIGRILYQEIIARMARCGCIAMVFEVEVPEDASSQSELAADYARRRIAWYRRQGARLLTGIHYVQDVGWQPPLEMHVMIHPFDEMDADQALAAANLVLGNGVMRRETPVLV